MRRASFLFAALAALALALSPVAADARAGGGSSMGSRGSRSFSAPSSTTTAPSAAPLERSMSQPPSYAPGAPSPAYGMSRPAFGGSSFVSGLMGGFLGAGIAGLLFGHGMFGGISGIGSFFWFLVQMALVALVVRFLFHRFVSARGPQPFFAGFGNLGRVLTPQMRSMGGGGARATASDAPRPNLSQADFQAFDISLQNVQAAWTNHDLPALRGMVTPEMLSYFAEQLSDQASRGVRNSVTDVRLLKGDLSEAWSENGRDYATVAMRFTMIDVTRDANGTVVDGSATEHSTATEIWTFARAGGGIWLLSAIQQAR